MNRNAKISLASLAFGLSAVIGLPATANAAEGPEADPATSAPVIVVTPAPAPATSPGMALMPAPAPAAAPPPPAYQPAVPGTNAPSPMLVDPRIAALKHQRAAGLGMTISGFTMFGTSYLLSALVGSISLDYAADVGGSGTYGRRMLVPVVGPFMAIPRTGSATGGLFTGLLGVVQVGGLVLGTSGAIKLGRANRQLALSADAGGIQLKF